MLFDEDVSLQHKDLKVTDSEVIESKALSRIETDVSQSVCKEVVDLNYLNLRIKEKPDCIVSVLNDSGTQMTIIHPRVLDGFKYDICGKVKFTR